jgi:hypothetical protein
MAEFRLTKKPVAFIDYRGRRITVGEHPTRVWVKRGTLFVERRAG